MNRKFSNVAVLKGGISAERDVSLESGRAVAGGLRAAGYNVWEIDVVDPRPEIPEAVEAVFIALHGTYGEDGGVQEYLESRGMPYTGSGPKASQIAFDKKTTKELLVENNVRTAPYQVLKRGESLELRLPVVVKPTREGSSIGISRVFDEADWDSTARSAFEYGDEIIAEKYIEGRECTVGIVDGEPLPIVEIVAPDGDYSYDAKYHDSATRYIVPADLPQAVAAECRAMAGTVFSAMECRGFARVDFLVDSELQPNVLELNSIPGFTPHSLLPKAAQAAGIDFPELCDRIMRLAENGGSPLMTFHRHHVRG